MRKHNTRERVGFRKLKPTAASINHSPLSAYVENAVEGDVLYRFMSTVSTILQNPSIFVEGVIGEEVPKASMTIIDEAGIEYSTKSELVEGANDFNAVTILPNHRLVVTLEKGSIEGVWVSAVAARRG